MVAIFWRRITRMLTVCFSFSMAILLLVAAFQSAYVLLYVCQIWHQKNVVTQNDKTRVAVILCLRGADPGLKKCLVNLHQQDYPDFEIHLVLDNENDPANRVLQGFYKSSSNRSKPIIHIREDIERQGSLKCQGLVHVISLLDSGVEVIVLLDADAVVDPTWLRMLVAPLADPKIGATTGNRWFTPQDDKLGSWVRQIWNAAAIVQMQLYQIAWGGSLAIRKDVMEESGLLNRWRTAFCEDTMISSVLEKHGLRVHRVPNLIVDNRESTSLSSCQNWIVRQLLTVRLYHKLWVFVMVHAISVGLAVLVPPIVTIVLIFAGEIAWANIVMGAWILFQVCNYLLIRVITKTNLRLIADGQANSRDIASAHPFKYGLSLIIAQLIQPYAALNAAFARTANWRGIRYRIGTRSIELEKYAVFQNEDDDATESIQ